MVSEAAGQLLSELESRHPAVLSRFDLAEIARHLDAVPAGKPYHQIPEPVSRLWAGAAQEYGETEVDALRRALLLWLICRFPARAMRWRYTPEVFDRFQVSLQRILSLAKSDNPLEYFGGGDLYIKDLSLCRQSAFPVGARQIVEQRSAFSRRMIFRSDVRQALAFTYLLLTNKGNMNYYQPHVHLLEFGNIDPPSNANVYVQIADMLAINSDHIGLFMAGWPLDPAIEKISPHLAFWRQVPVANGAFLFFSSVDMGSGAFAKSEKRRRLHEEGKYIPKSYAIVWPRKALLSWADRYRRGELGPTL